MHADGQDLIDFALGDGILLSPVQQAIDWVVYSSDGAGELRCLVTCDFV